MECAQYKWLNEIKIREIYFSEHLPYIILSSVKEGFF